MDDLNKIIKILRKFDTLEKEKSTLVKKYNSSINSYRTKVLNQTTKTNTLYDFYHSYKHYVEMNKNINYFKIYYKINNRYMPIVTDFCLHGDTIKHKNYDDCKKIATGTLSSLTIYCDSINAEIFPKEFFFCTNMNNYVENIDFD